MKAHQHSTDTASIPSYAPSYPAASGAATAAGNAQDMLAIAQRLAGLPAAKRAVFRQRLRENGIDFSGLPIVPLNERPARIPLSFAQQRLWFLHQLEPGSAAYNIQAVLRLEGQLDVRALESAFREMIRRHESLRTLFCETDGKAEQRVVPADKAASGFTLSIIDLAGLPASIDSANSPGSTYPAYGPTDGSEVVAEVAVPVTDDIQGDTDAKVKQRIQRFVRAEAEKPFDLVTGPLLRVALLKQAERDFILLVTIHHIVSDGWSMQVLLQELRQYYEAASMEADRAAYLPSSHGPTCMLPPLPIQYADFAIWQQEWLTEEALATQLNYWKEQLGQEHPVLELPSDWPRPAYASGKGAKFRFELKETLAEQVRSFSKEQRVTLFTALLAAFDVLLYRLTGQADIRVGVPIANRNRLETEGIIGFFVNTQVVRAEFNPAMNFSQLLSHTREAVLGAQAHQDLPFEQLVEALQPERHLSHTPLFQVMFNLQGSRLEGKSQATGSYMGEVKLQLLPQDSGAAQFDLSLDIMERQGRLEATFTYSTDLFEASTIERFAGYYTNLLQAAVADPSARISQLPMLGETEYQCVTSGWAVAEMDDLSTEPLLVHQSFEAQAEAAPEAIALVYDDVELSYVELNTRANRLAHRLLARGIRADERVGVCIERSPEMVVTLLAILKAGAAYVPLDPGYPLERLAYMVEDADIALLLTQSHVKERLSLDWSQLAVLDVTDTSDESDASFGLPDGSTSGSGYAPDTSYNPAVTVQPQQLAYVMYTSGSTGRPKGVGIAHAALAAHTHVAREFFGLKRGEHMLQFSTFNFDGFVEQLYPALSCGATVVLRGPDLWDSEELYARILRHRITVADLTTAYWFQVVQDWANQASSAPRNYGALRQINVGGEAMPPEGLEAWNKAGLGSVRLLNTYGPTEAAVTAMVHDCEGYITGRKAKPVQMPIGHALPGRRLYLLDTEANPVPIGVTGELCVGGELLARGYHGRPDQTADRFMPDPFGQPGSRLYRTGDLARWRADGVMEYLGRLDHQVKIRGFRIELPEIEGCLLAHPAIREAAVIVREDRPGDKRLVAYVVVQKNGLGGGSSEESSAEFSEKASDEVTEKSLRRYLSQSLPDYMVPSALVYLEAMPISPNGKLDRKALPIPDYAAMATQTATPRTPLEAQLLAIWSEVLGGEGIGIHDNFFLLGGHSLLATRLVSRIRSTLQYELPVRTLFEAPTIAQLAERMQPASGEDLNHDLNPELAPIQPVARTGQPLPLSFAQQRLWFLYQMEPESAAYTMPAAVRLIGRLDVEVLKRSFEALVNRHETLRTTFREEEGEPVQVIAPQISLDMPLIDLALTPQNEKEYEIKRIAEAEAATPFDLLSGPLLRLRLLRLSGNEHVLLATMHHIVSDGWSMSVLTREFSAFYAALLQGQPLELAPLPIQYADFAAWQRQHASNEKLQKELDYWKAQLGTDHPVLELPADRPRPSIQSGRGARYRTLLDKDIAESLQHLCHQQGASLFMALLAVFNILLARLSGQSDIRVGVPIANRNRIELEGLIGFFVNTQVLRMGYDGKLRFVELLEAAKRAALGAQEHQNLPFEHLVEALQPERSLSHSPMFQVMFNLIQSDAAALPELPGLMVQALEREDSVTQFDLSLDIVERETSLEALFTYSTDLFEASTIERFAAYYTHLLRAVAANPQARISQLPMLGKTEYQCVTSDWAVAELTGLNTNSPSGKWLSVHQSFEEQAVATPEAIALVFDDVEMSYGKLNSCANRLAHHLIARGIRADNRVGVCVERSVEMIIALLAILKAGAAYVPLDPSYPLERLTYMIQDAGITLLLTQNEVKQSLPLDWNALGMLDVNEFIQDDADASTGSTTSNASQDPAVTVHPQQLAYVMYTSGSTGRPKGVSISHATLAAHTRVAREFYSLKPFDRILQFSTFNFDGFVEQLYPGLSCGATVVLRGPDLWDSEELYARILRHRITVVDLTTAYWFQVVQDWANQGSSGKRDYGILRQITVGGEAMPPEGLAAWNKAGLGSVRLLNAYGPTEAAVTAMVHDCEGYIAGRKAKPAQMPIGHPLPGRRLYLLDAEANPVPIGVTGELCIGGELLARGYHGRPDQTADRFMPDPFGQPGSRLYRTGDLARWRADGVMEYLGRLDHQVKIRGFRIELPEIEGCLLAHPAIREAAVIVREDRPGDKRLVAYVVVQKSGLVDESSEESGENVSKEASEENLRRHLSHSLPDYMVPSALVYLETMPINPNGKLDRNALPVPDYAVIATDPATPRTPLEAQLLAIWSEVLAVEGIGIHDNFFLLGGHSLLATKLVSRIRSTLQCELPVRTLFEAPTIAQLAERVHPASGQALMQKRNPDSSHGLAPIQPIARTGQPLPLSFAQQRLWFLYQMEPESAAYTMSAAVRLIGSLDVEALKRSFEALVNRHETLRTTFREENGEAVQVIDSQASLELPVIDLSMRSKEAKEKEVKRFAEMEATKAFQLASGPLLRLLLLRLSGEEHVLLLTMHHIVSDDWSMSLLTKEFSILYSAALQSSTASLPTLPIQYADFAAWQRQWLAGGELQKQLDYWKMHLGDEHPLLALPTDWPRPAMQSGRGAAHRWTLEPELLLSLQSLCRQQGVTLFMALLAVFNVLLHRLSGQCDIRVGVPVANRNRIETESLIGFFVNTQVMRTQMGAGQSVSGLLAQTREAALGAQAHQDLPFEHLVEALQPERNLSHSPLFQVMFNLLQSTASTPLELPGLTLLPVRSEEITTQFDLSLDIMERQGTLEATFTYSTDLFEASTIERFAGYYTNLLQAAVADPSRRISQLSMLSETEYQCVMSDWAIAELNADSGEHVGELLPVHQNFEAQAAVNPEAIALVFDDKALSYGELNAQANRLAHRLLACGIRADERVGVCIERSPEMIVALLAILKAGAAYVPLDPNYPLERLAYMVEDADIALLLTQSHVKERLSLDWNRLTMLDVADSSDGSDAFVGLSGGSAGSSTGGSEWHNPAVTVQPQQLAYVMYTSGSTGRPKGVGIAHAALAAHTRVAREFFGLKPGERMLQFSTFNFDGFVEQLYPALSCGATVVLRGPDLWDSEELYARILRHRITVADLTTAYWFQVVQDWAGHTRSSPRNYGALRQINVGGEAMPPEGLAAWNKAGLASVRLLNTYGPTEAAVTAMVHDCEGYITGRKAKPAHMPIGHALPGRRLYLLDAEANPVPIGVTGELCIGGELLARGYHGRPDQTADRFMPDPFGQPGSRLYRTGDLARWRADGVMEYLGRLDHQVKIHGFRIELPEIEGCLLAHPAIREAAVIVREDRPGDKRLVAYVVVQKSRLDDQSSEEAGEENLRRHLSQSLPDYMVPSALVYLEAMPISPNGKLDRNALPVPDYAVIATDPATPRTPLEAQLLAIWSEVLAVEGIGIHDNFFLLGGHSLLATKLVSRIRSTLQCELPVRTLFEAPTIAQLAERMHLASGQVLMQKPNPDSSHGLAPIQPIARTGQPLPLSFAQQRLWFLYQMEPESAAYTMPAAVRLIGSLDVEALKRSFEALVNRHETLRTTFREEEGEPVQVIAPQSPLDISLTDLSSLPAEDREAEVRRRISHELEQPFDLIQGPVLRLRLLKLSGNEHVLLLAMHHIAADGWSMGTLVQEFATLYAAFKDNKANSLPPLPIQYADFAVWQRKRLSGAELNRQLAYWRSQLGNAHTVLDLPFDHPRPAVMSGRGARYRFEIDPQLTEKLHAVSRSHGTTLFMTLLAAFDIWLYAHTGQRHPVVGTDIANRNRAETERVLGFFVNQLALKADLDGNPHFSDVLARTRNQVLEAYSHQDLPFNTLVEALNPIRSLAYTPLFQVKLVLQNQAEEPLVLPGLEIQPQTIEHEQAEFDVLLVVTEMATETGSALECLLKYTCDLFDHETIVAFAQQYAALLNRCVADPSSTLDTLAHVVSGMAREMRLARQQKLSTQGVRKLQSARRKSISFSS